jgi:hypothetical protein
MNSAPNSEMPQEARREETEQALRKSQERFRARLDSIFPGDSEMARLMRAFDWSTSEVGVFRFVIFAFARRRAARSGRWADLLESTEPALRYLYSRECWTTANPPAGTPTLL